jgi:N4-bis(aminopropyl)spermidine synthase
MDIDAIAADVAAAVGLAEGESGVRDVLRVVALAEPVATSMIGRQAELPVPIVAAVCNELRKRGVIDKTRPVRLTAIARAILAADRPALEVECACCGGLGQRIPAELGALSAELESTAAGAPPAKMELDQTHCTVATKIHRVLRLHQAGALDGRRILLLGDDDLIAVAVARFARLTKAAVGPLTVIDADPAVLAWIAAQVSGTPVQVSLVEHDLRKPLPAGLAGAFDVACTDPPYTVPGAELFLSRAVAALEPRNGQHIFFSFGARRPAQMLATQRLIAGLGLVIKSLTPNFNSYIGAGILAGTSHLYHLRTSDQTAPLVEGEHTGPLYTADARAGNIRPYRCADCGTVQIVGRADGQGDRPGWAQIKDLQAAGCPVCGGVTFRPMPRRPR